MDRELHTARLVSITPDAEKQIVYMARVSNPHNQSKNETAPKLIRYLLKHNHVSPFEMCSMQVEINTTRAIAAQILRHRSFSFQEFSQRYSDVSLLPPLGLPHLRSQDSKNKQASHDDLDPALVKRYNRYIQELYDGATDLYHNMLEHGVAKECARSILPLGTPTRMYMAGTIRSWLHYLGVRAGVETQLEHRLIAEKIKEILKEQMPDIYEAFFD
jgi:thymidylate synthase (FAD)